MMMKSGGPRYDLLDNGDKSATKKKRFGKSLSKQLGIDALYLLFLLVINGIYLYAGGLIFYALENRDVASVKIRSQVASFLDTLKATSFGASFSHTNKTGEAMASELSEDDLILLKSALKGIHLDRKSEEIQRWTLPNSVFFASTVVTTIGLGHPAPRTDKGRAFCVLYVLLGIPLTFHLLSTIGRVLAKYLSEIYGFMVKRCRKYCKDNEESSSEDNNDLKLPFWIPCLMLCAFLAASTAIMMYVENWDIRISLYYIFMALTTVGLGDVLPNNEKAVWFHILFLYLGLATVSLTINLLLVNVKTRIYKNPFGCKFMKSINYHEYSQGNEPDHAELIEEANMEDKDDSKKPKLEE